MDYACSTSHPEGQSETTVNFPDCGQYHRNRRARCVPSNGESVLLPLRAFVLLPSGCLQARACRDEIKHGNILRCMSANDLNSQYALGSTEAEHERLIRQAAWLTVHTERLFREADMGPGQR